MATHEQLLQALAAVTDPNTGKDFVSTKQLKNLQVEGGDWEGCKGSCEQRDDGSHARLILPSDRRHKPSTPGQTAYLRRTRATGAGRSGKPC